MKRILRSPFFWIILCAVCLSIPIGRRWLIVRHYEEADRKASEVRKEYAAQMRSKLPDYFKGMTYVTDAGVRASSELIYHQIFKECWMDSVTITLRVVNGFDRLSDNEQYDYLCEFARIGEQAIRSVVQRNVPDYKDVRSDFWNAVRDYKDIWYSVQEEYSYIVKTDSNTYEYAHNVKDYFVLNGEDHFTAKHWQEYYEKNKKKNSSGMGTYVPSGKSSSGSSKKNSTAKTYGDPIDPDDYDIEAYYEDYRDEFEDFDDAYDAFLDDEEAWDYYR